MVWKYGSLLAAKIWLGSVDLLTFQIGICDCQKGIGGRQHQSDAFDESS